VTPDLQVTEIAEGVWMHTSWRALADGTRFPSNGLLLRDGEALLLIDTAWGEEPTADLLQWIDATLRRRVSAAVATHFHDDRMGGAAVLAARRIPLHAHPLTRELAQGSEEVAFIEGLRAPGSAVRFGPVELFYPGPAHTRDNIVVWLPRQRILFGGCAVRALSTRSAGNTTDADVAAWPRSIERVLRAYPSAKLVVPGHGEAGGPALLGHTIEVLEAAAAAR
jgi:metallo-beta-lactamase class B VIM